MAGQLLRVRDLTVAFGRNRVVDRVNFDLEDNQVIGIVGESGSGKTVTSLALMRLFRPPARLENGQVWLRDRDLLAAPEEYLRQVRGRDISMIFQNPRSALNPLMKVGDQIERVFRTHQIAVADPRAETLSLLRRVGLSDPEVRARSYPHQLSGGMRQRVMIAMALACQPQLLIADEPTTGLDVTIEAQIFDLMKELRAQRAMAMILITHDLGVVADNCQRVVVMYGGQVVETADVDTLFHGHKHPYTTHLLASVMALEGTLGAPASDRGRELIEVQGPTSVSRGPLDFTLAGCRFSHRCPHATQICYSLRPPLQDLAPGHAVACHLYGEGK